MASPNHEVLQTLKGKLSADSICTHMAHERQSKVCQGLNRNTYVHGVMLHETTCRGTDKPQHHAAAEGTCLSGGRAGSTRTQSLINGRGSAFPYTGEPVLSCPPPPALCSPLSAAQHFIPLFPSAHSRIGIARAGEYCTAATRKGSHKAFSGGYHWRDAGM